MEYINGFLNCILLAMLQLHLGGCAEFNKNYTGVQFNPYVKNAVGRRQIIPNKSQYALHEVKIMLEIVSRKFSRVITDTVDALNVSYDVNATYYKNAHIIARTAEAASLINRERNNLSLTVIIGIRRYDDDLGGENRTATEVEVALKAAETANTIYPGTVAGFQLANVLSGPSSARLGCKWVEYLRDKTESLDLQIGALVHLDNLVKLNVNGYINTRDSSTNTTQPISTLISMLNFITCKFYVDTNLALNGKIENFAFFGAAVIAHMNLVMSLNRNATVMGSTGWASDGGQNFQTVDNLRNYWIEIGKFAVNHSMFIWFEEAFDNPLNAHFENDSPHKGWWRLRRNHLANRTSGYVEKILEPRSRRRHNSDSPDTQTQGIWIYVGIGIIAGAVIVILLLAKLIYLYKKMSALQEALTKEEINEFRNGTSAIQENDEVVCGLAMKKPYDQSLEISEDLIEIYWNQILGMGQFGCVFKALWKCQTAKEVALKTTKRDCPATAIRGILSEIKILAHLGQHPNIVSICGAYTAELAKGKVYLATELCTLGSLKNYLVRLSTNTTGNNSYENLVTNQDEMMRWSFEIACGMEHLGDMGVIHADLATRNVLLSGDGTAKISDFGLSRRLYDYSSYVKQQHEPLPFRSMAIESLKMMMFTHQSDVWSYGVTLWEIFSLGAEPYPGLSWTVDFVDRLENGLRMTRPRLATSEIYDLMLDCWQSEPDKRPTFRVIKNRILDICNMHRYANVNRNKSKREN